MGSTRTVRNFVEYTGKKKKNFASNLQGLFATLQYKVSMTQDAPHMASCMLWAQHTAWPKRKLK